ncbi:hypothetical protein [Oceanirhabdus seepicola]|uniref:Protein phosphatase 2C domain-containing protein n=1 Tax=Oceanirhabdus seepicola TaxID=2828781 RepID=A0A9J6NWU7_9CLOT|nr:hypothetical protein [Oceanirhabdus seepicola]MCM1988739.1 hypothetical protein [Oceanirhabdus seepicola]
MKIDSYTHSVKIENEDCFGVTATSAFVMDGASSLSDCHFTPALNDVVWMRNWWQNYLLEHLDDLETPLIKLLEQGVKDINEEFSEYTPVESLSKLEQVSASIAIVRKNKNFMECFVLGDVEISLKREGQSVEVLTDERIKPLDQKVIQFMSKNTNRLNKCVFKGFTEEELALLKKNRMKMNTENGYYILSHDESAIANGIYKRYPLDYWSSCLLASDGVSILDKYYPRSELMELMRTKGVKSLIEVLRGYEGEDEKMVSLRRLKAHDDATAVYIEY